MQGNWLTRPVLFGLIGIGSALAPSGAAAQVPSLLPDADRDASGARFFGPKEFGAQDEGITVIGFTAFLPPSSSYEYDTSPFDRWPTGGGDALQAPVGGIPDGATLTQVVFYFRDDSDVHDFHGQLRRVWVDSSTGVNAALDTPVDIVSSGSPGEGQVNDVTSLPIRYRYDIDGDGTSEVVNYFLRVYTGAFNGDVRIRGARLTWRRNVSPAPTSATFNDVPTSDGAFQFVEALAASGITAGCGGGNYCPDAPLTRRQMAVFLAQALGLHWAPFAP